ncbi:hypothetical protein BHYA_0071g00200 [Botrytis hyacinthi]|uniref:Uncharacterized protein n=1 Tax=Botrytis hyacinthi TaxID=278943 RepID=A0A4Z1GUG7_9HELO|nr:hypothetical protein BHYA_0071g00200 [Botrytis hyacinthi]
MWQASVFETKKFTDLLIQESSKVTLKTDCMLELTLHCVTQSFFDLELTFEYFKEGFTGSKQVKRNGFITYQAKFEANHPQTYVLSSFQLHPKLTYGPSSTIAFETIQEADRVYRDLYSHIEDMCEEAFIKHKQHAIIINITFMDTLISRTMPNSAKENGKIMLEESLISNVFLFILSGCGTV